MHNFTPTSLITEICLVIIVLSLAVIGFYQLFKYIQEKSDLRAKRRIQRDENSRKIKKLELRVTDLEGRK